jgi:hypothetical protein
MEDYLFPGMFEPVSPEQGFEQYYGEEDDMAWVWKRAIDNLPAESQMSFSYEVRLLNPTREIRLDSTTVRINGKIASYSNDVSLVNGEEGCGNMVCDPGEMHETCPDDCAEIEMQECNSAYDGVCNPECPEIDIDCTPTTTEDPGSMAVWIILITVAAVLVFISYRHVLSVRK